MDKKQLCHVYYTMNVIRDFENQALKFFEENVLRGSVHLCVGEEAVPATVCELLNPDDYIASTHRGHGHCLAKGADPGKALAELMGREDGYCRGRGGSMHIADVDSGNLGANAILGVSLAMAHAAAAACRLPLWQYLTRFTGRRPALPRPMMNILNGGRHAPNNIDIQEFMVIPLGCPTFADGLERCVRVTHRLGALLEEAGLACGVGDEGGFAPQLKNEEQALELILRAIEDCRLRPGEDMALALDAAAGEWQTGNNMYLLPKENRLRTPHDLLEYWRRLTAKYPIISLEDPAGEDDWDLWRQLTEAIGKNVQLVGDDLFVTQKARLEQGLARRAANAVLIKPNQVGTLTETLETVVLAQQSGYGAILSHRSGETEDTTIADLAVATACGQIKTGAPCRSERTAKYNRLLRIEAMLEEMV